MLPLLRPVTLTRVTRISSLRLTSVLLGVVCCGLLAAEAAAQSNGRLRPGDRIVVAVRDTTDSATIRSDGTAVLPTIGTLALAGLTPRAAEDSAMRVFARFVSRPDLRVTALRRISVQGEVPNADIFYVDETMGLAEALALAGGVGLEGDRRRVELWRDGRRVGTYDSRSGAELRAPLESGDIIIVARASWVERNPFAVVSLVSTLTTLILFLVTR